jgi:hypothetical protein
MMKNKTRMKQLIAEQTAAIRMQDRMSAALLVVAHRRPDVPA